MRKKDVTGTFFDLAPLLPRVESDLIFDKDNPEKFHPLGLFSEQIFGPIKNFTCQCGKTLPPVAPPYPRCPDCGVEFAPASERHKRIAVIKLPFKIPYFHSPLLGKIVIQKLREIKFWNNDFYEDLLLELITKTIKPPRLVKLFEQRDALQKKIGQLQRKLEKGGRKGAEDKLLLLQKELENLQEQLKAIFEEILKLKPEMLKTYTSEYIPVLPPEVRPIHRFKNLDEINRYYLKLIRASRRFEKGNVGKVWAAIDILQTWREFYSVLIEKWGAKDSGLTRGRLQGKRISFSGRCYTVPDVKLLTDTVEIPVYLALKIYEDDIIREMGLHPSDLEHLLRISLKYEEASKEEKKKLDEFVKRFNKTFKETVAYIHRNPTLHEPSMQPYKIRVHAEGDVIKVPLGIQREFNMDFDGDQLAVYPLKTQETCEWTKEKYLHPKLNIHPGKLNVSPLDKELASGIQLLTADPEPDTDNPESWLDGNPFAVYTPQQLYERYFGSEKPLYGKLFDEATKLVRIKMNEDGFITTTVGRLLFERFFDLAPGTIKSPVDKRFLERYLTDLFFKDKARFFVVLNSLLNLARRMANNITINGFDFYAPELDEALKAFKKKWKRVLKLQNGILSLRQQEQVLREIEELYRLALERLPKLKRAKGTKLAKVLKQVFIARGFVRDLEGHVLPRPILGAYVDGLDDEELFLAAEGARAAVMDKTNNVRQSGYMLRKGVFAFEHVFLKKERPDKCSGSPIEIEIKKDELFARYLYRTVLIPKEIASELNVPAETKLTPSLISKLEALMEQRGINSLRLALYSPLTCTCKQGYCKTCYPEEYAYFGQAAGIIASQAITEDLTQSLLRTFHTGGAVEGKGEEELPPWLDLLGEELVASEEIILKEASLEEDEEAVLTLTDNSGRTYELTFASVSPSAKLKKLLKGTVDEVKFEENEIIAEVKSLTGGLMTLAKYVDKVMKSSRFIPPLELLDILKPVNCQSLYKEVWVAEVYVDRKNKTPARLEGNLGAYNPENYEKVSYELLPLLKSPALAVHFQRVKEVLKHLKTNEKSFSSPLLALIESDFEKLKRFFVS